MKNQITMKKHLFSQFAPVQPRFRVVRVFSGLACLCVAVTGCQLLTYSSPTGERFTRSSLGANTAISSLTVESGTNGLRRVSMHGYQNDTSQALGAVTDAAVRAAIGAAKP
jgi:hypothetical protein